MTFTIRGIGALVASALSLGLLVSTPACGGEACEASTPEGLELFCAADGSCTCSDGGEFISSFTNEDLCDEGVSVSDVRRLCLGAE